MGAEASMGAPPGPGPGAGAGTGAIEGAEAADLNADKVKRHFVYNTEVRSSQHQGMYLTIAMLCDRNLSHMWACCTATMHCLVKACPLFTVVNICVLRSAT